MYFSKHSSHALLGLVLASTCASATSTTNSTDHWWQKPFEMFQTNLREIDADMDVEAVGDYIQQHGATAWLQSVGGILANYPTELEFQIENPMSAERESGDLIQDTLDAARARDIRLLGRMDFSKVQLPVAEAHPEWLYISPNGTWQNHTNDLVSVCPSAGWYQERVFDILDEVMTRYELDGFFINWAGFNENDYFRVYHGVCHCESCQKGWAEYTDDELPEGPEDDNYDEWKIWSDGVIQDWTGRVRDFIAEKLPDAGLILGESADIMFYEANNAVDREIWHHATSETASKFASHRPDVPILVNSASFIDHAYRITPENAYHFAQYHLQAISRGANPSTYIIGIPEKIPWAGMDIVRDLMRFHQNHSDVYAGMKPVARTGLVLPQGAQFENDTDYEASLSEFKGLYKSLQELHVPFDVIAQQYILDIADSGGFDRYRAVILPNMGAINSSDAEALDDWAASGGTLIATGAVGVESDEDEGEGEEEDDAKKNEQVSPLQLQSLPASRRLNFTTEFQDLWSVYFAPEQDRTEEHYYEGALVPLLDTYGLYDWDDESDGLYKKLDYAPFAPPEYIYGNVQVDERGAGYGPFEDGTGVLVTFPVGSGYRETGLEVFREFFEDLWDIVGSDEVLEFDLLQQVEVTINENAAGQTVVHLINMSGIRYQNFGPHVPMPAGSMKVTAGGAGISARTLVTGLQLEVEEDGTIQLPGFDLFDVVVIEGLD